MARVAKKAQTIRSTSKCLGWSNKSNQWVPLPVNGSIPVTRVSNVKGLEEAEFHKLTSAPPLPIPLLYNFGNRFEWEGWLKRFNQ